jgi:hypothetical protein
MKVQDSKAVFYKYFPPAAVEYCFSLWTLHKFYFKITKSRASKLGDFRYDPTKSYYTITVNADLNPYSFLITYIHEVAHLLVHKKYKNTVAPHGAEWKYEFSNAAIPILNLEVFPEAVLHNFKRYLLNPKASTVGDIMLHKELRKYDSDYNKTVLLESIPNGTEFLFKKRRFVKKQLQKTKVLCTENATGRQYLISKTAPVTLSI